MTKERTSPNTLWRHAQQFAHAARVIRHEHKGNRVLFPAYYLIGHSIELSLKAFLLRKGIPVSELKSRKYGHDVEVLLKEARRRRLGAYVKLSQKDVGVLYLLSYEYVAKKYEYLESGTYHLPDISFVQDIASRLVDGLKDYCVANKMNSYNKSPQFDALTRATGLKR